MSTEVDNVEYRTVHDGLLRLHKLFLEGKERSPEADEIRDASEGPWRQLSKEQRRLLSGLSKDLNDIKHETEVDQEGAVSPVFAKALKAQYAGNYSEALDILRTNKAIPPFSRISYLRGRNWEDAGEPKTALLFFQHAAKLAPENEEYQAAALGAFYEAHPEEGRVAADIVLNEPQAHPVAVIVRACEIRFQDTYNAADEKERLPVYKQIIQALHVAIILMQERPRRLVISQAQPVYGVVCSLLATCCRNLGMIDPAFHYYTIAIGLDPLNTPLLIARGSLLYGQTSSATEFAAQDFARATQVGTDIGIPYYFLAHFYLHHGQYERAVEAVAEGIARLGSNRLKSEMLEYRAIALAAMRADAASVTEAFHKALQLDESNDRAKQNLQVYQQMVEKKSAKPAAEPWVLKFDAGRVARELPRPRTLRETYDDQKRMAG